MNRRGMVIYCPEGRGGGNLRGGGESNFMYILKKRVILYTPNYRMICSVQMERGDKEAGGGGN